MPCTFKDLVGQVAYYQCVYLDILSWLDFQEHFSPRWGARIDDDSKVIEGDSSRMGTYTTQPGTVQWLYGAGIPVWYVGHIESIESVNVDGLTPSATLMEVGSSSRDWMDGAEEDPFPTIFFGPPGERRQRVVKRMGSFLAHVANISAHSAELEIPPAPPERDRPSPCKSNLKIL
jgi:hypothetical protein